MRPHLTKAQLKKASSSRTGKIVKWTVGIVAVLILGITLWLNIGLAPTIRRQLETRVSEATKGNYQLQIDRVGINFLTSSISLNDIKLKPTNALLRTGDSARSNISMDVDNIRFKNVKWRQYLSDKKIHLKGIYIDEPTIVINQGRKQPDSDTASRKDLTELLSQLKNDIQVGEIVISDGSLVHTAQTPKGKARQSADHIQLSMHDIRLDSATRTTPNQALAFLDKLEISLQNYTYMGGDSIYKLQMQKVTLEPGHDISIKNLAFQPTISDREFVKRHKYQKDRFIIKAPSIVLKGIQLKEFFQQSVIARSVHINNPTLNIYRDKRAPKLVDNNHPLMPQEAIQGIGFAIQIDSTFITGATINYAEQAEQAPKPGKISFTKSNIQVTNLTNNPARMTDRTPARVIASSMLMNNGLLNLNLSINLLSRYFDVNYKGSLNQMSVMDFNQISLPNENIRIVEGSIHKITFASNVRRGVARGQLKALYEDLKLEILDPDDKSKRGMLTFLSNLAVRTKNIDDEKKPARVASILYARDVDDSFVNFLWQSLRSGVLAAVTPVNVDRVKEIREKVAQAKAIQKHPVAKPKAKGKFKKDTLLSKRDTLVQ
jgi:hypothetical protein